MSQNVNKINTIKQFHVEKNKYKIFLSTEVATNTDAKLKRMIRNETIRNGNARNDLSSVISVFVLIPFSVRFGSVSVEPNRTDYIDFAIKRNGTEPYRNSFKT